MKASVSYKAIVQRKGDEAANAYPRTRILRTLEDPAIQLIALSSV